MSQLSASGGQSIRVSASTIESTPLKKEDLNPSLSQYKITKYGLYIWMLHLELQNIFMKT